MEEIQPISDSPRACVTTYHGLQAIQLNYGNYQATAIPEVGGNLVSFRDVHRKLTLLHEPTVQEINHFKEAPYLYGIPVLLPQNRVEDGTMTFRGRTYQLPVNEPERNNHLHGFLYDVPWNVVAFGADEIESYVTLELQVHEGHPIYAFWPHDFTIQIHYALSAMGLSQHTLIRNDGGEPMPCLLGYHTALNAPFAENASADDYRLRVTIGERYELSERGLPTGKVLQLGDFEEAIKDAGAYPFGQVKDHHYAAKPVNGRNRMELLDTKNQVELVYDVGSAFRYWMIFNNFGREGFFCAEPQVNMVNAPNLEALSDEHKGLFSIEAGDIWEEVSRLFVREV